MESYINLKRKRKAKIDISRYDGTPVPQILHESAKRFSKKNCLTDDMPRDTKTTAPRLIESCTAKHWRLCGIMFCFKLIPVKLYAKTEGLLTLLMIFLHFCEAAHSSHLKLKWKFTEISKWMFQTLENSLSLRLVCPFLIFRHLSLSLWLSLSLSLSLSQFLSQSLSKWLISHRSQLQTLTYSHSSSFNSSLRPFHWKSTPNRICLSDC